MTRYPDIEVRLIGRDGNAFGILGQVQNALRQAGVPRAEQRAFFDQATAGDYNNLLRVCMEWVNVV